jgi:hypothetical protein
MWRNMRTAERSSDAESANESRAQIRHDIPVQVRHQEHVELRRVHHKMHARRVDDAVVAHDVRIAARDLLHAAQEESIAHLHDVRLVDDGDAAAAMQPRMLEGEFRHARGRLFRDDLQALHDPRHDFVLQA